MTLLVGFIHVSIGMGVGYILCAIFTAGRFNDLENEIIALENENDALRGGEA